MNLSDILQQISQNYSRARTEPFKNHEMLDLVNRKLRTAIPSYLLEDNYDVKGSVGKGNWALIPWIAVFDTEITKSATNGFYIVLIPTSDYQSFYLSLNQGWTFFEEGFGREKHRVCKHVSRYWQSTLDSLTASNGFSTDEIDLKVSGIRNNRLAIGYEYGNIYSKKFTIDASLDNEEILAGIEHLKTALKELKFKLPKPGQGLRSNIDAILDISTEAIVTRKELDVVNQHLMDTALVEFSPPNNPNVFETTSGDSMTIRKLDYVERQRNNMKLGDVGEDLVFQHEIKLARSNPTLAAYLDQIEHVSKTKGDGLGYDIVSIRECPDGTVRKVYLEVKATKEGIDSPFFISHHEIEVSGIHGNDYFLVRVFNIGRLNPGFYYVNGPLSDNLQLKEVNYLAFPI